MLGHQRKWKFVLLSLCVATTALVTNLGTPATASNWTGPQLEFAAGETTTHCLSSDPSFCPRDLTAFTPQVWQLLADHHAGLDLNLVYGADFGPVPAGLTPRNDAIGLIRTANQLHIPVNAWLTLPLADGTFATEANAGIVQQAVKDLAAWSTQLSLRFHETLLDLEQPTGDQPVSEAMGGNLTGITALMSANIDPARQCAAMRTYRDTINWAHQNGIRIAGTPVPFAFDDIQDGNTGLQDALDITAFPPLGYDQWMLQAYRSNFVNPGNVIDLGSGYVARYYREMQRQFGAIGQVGIGDTGIAPYDNLGPLVSDIRMLSALGASSVLVFDLDSTVKTFGTTGLTSVLTAPQNPMSATELAAAQVESPNGIAARNLFGYLNQLANTLTLSVTLAQGHPQAPNAYPNGCGDLSTVPLK